MSRREEMSWSTGAQRWHRMIDGKRIWRSPRQLGGRTKDETRDAANEFWRAFEQEHYKSKQNPAALVLGAIEAAGRLFSPNENQAYPHLADYVDIQPWDDNRKLLMKMALFGRDYIQEIKQPLSILPDLDSVPEGETIGHQVANWLQKQERRLKMEKDGIKPGTYEAYKFGSDSFLEGIGKETSVKEINEALVSKYATWLDDARAKRTGKPLAANSKASKWDTFQAIINDFYTQHVIEALPRNIKSFSFSTKRGKVNYWTPADFQDEYKKADEFGKLILLLAANCGYYGCDMGHLDYNGGNTIRTKRHKTRDNGSPEIEYTLWPETISALKKSGHLLKGAWTDEVINGKRRKTDKIGSHAKRFKKLIRFLRHTGNQALRDSIKYVGYMCCFLCDTSSDKSNKVYSEARLPHEVAMYLHDWYFGK